MARIYKRNHKSSSFGGVLTNIDDPDAPESQDLTGATQPVIIFYHQDGVKVELDAELVDDNSDLTDGAEIVYRDSGNSLPSILDKKGFWEYTVGIRFSNGNYILSPDHDCFWVVP